MKKLKHILCVMLCAALLPVAPLSMDAGAEEKTMDIVIDGSKAKTAENMRNRGAGMVSGNNSSRLLLDYKTENPDAYWEILNYIFGEKGIGITHLKLEMGSDINSSSGTEPAVKRTADEKADVTRGAGYQLAADALTINPDLTLDMLWWSEPLWVTKADDRYAARYQWYKETLDAAYETYGLKFQYVSATQNEKAIDPAWIKYLSAHLKAEQGAPYDYAAIKIAASDEVGGWSIATRMLADPELLDAVDVMSSHYTSWSTPQVKKLVEEYGKEAWFGEGCSPMSYAQGTYRYDGNGSGLNDINGLLDIANRIITMVPGGDMNLYEYQPVVSSYYDGVTYCQKQLITANEPWSGNYLLDSGFYMSLHFSQFIKKGWAYVDGACAADGVAGGDGHAIVDAIYSYLTATDTATGDYSTVITNTTADPITYHMTVKNLAKAASAVDVWETRGPDGGAYDANYFKKINTITPVEANGVYTYDVTVKPYSMVTVSTVAVDASAYGSASGESKILALPYADDYEYAGYAQNYLASRGSAPRYTTDEGGAFEVVNRDGNNVLMQKITPETKANEWGATPNPTTNFGDDRWLNYSVSADVTFAQSDKPQDNYTGVGLRYSLGCEGTSGYWLKMFADGSWKLMKNRTAQCEGKLEKFDSTAWTNLKIEANGNLINAYINGTLVQSFTETGALLGAGRAALYSSYNQNCFDNFRAEAVAGAEAYITRYDNTDALVSYTGDWTHTTMSGFANYKRTISEAGAGAAVTVQFNGTGFLATGAMDKSDCTISVKIDGEVVSSSYAVPVGGARQTTYSALGLANGAHTAELTVLSGTLRIDSVQVMGGSIKTTAMAAATGDESDKTDETEQPARRALPYILGGIGVLAAAAVVTTILRKKKKK
ncbi:MAG: glycosyl hydrolase family 59 [Oscillospiraceae bacterium]